MEDVKVARLKTIQNGKYALDLINATKYSCGNADDIWWIIIKSLYRKRLCQFFHLLIWKQVVACDVHSNCVLTSAASKDAFWKHLLIDSNWKFCVQLSLPFAKFMICWKYFIGNFTIISS